jgi:hypothetical protein
MHSTQNLRLKQVYIPHINNLSQEIIMLKTYTSLIVICSLSCVVNAEYPKLLDNGNEIQLAAGTASFPPGLYVMSRYKQVMKNKLNKFAPILKIARKPYIKGIALGITWEDLEPQPGKVSAECLRQSLDRIKAASKLAKRKKPLVVLFKPYFYKMPKWMMTKGKVDKPTPGRNSIGMTVLKLPDCVNGTGDKISKSDTPLSTDKVYHRKIGQLVRCVADFLGEYDPEGVMVPLFHFSGPGMTSNQMRPPLQDKNIFPDSGNSSLIPGWSKDKHIRSWIEVVKYMKGHPALAKRCWVFNFTNLDFNDGRLSLSTKDQARVYDALKKAHPAGPGAVIAKTESLCVNFDRRLTKRGNKGKVKMANPTANWRTQALEHPKSKPYKYIINQKYAHAWENWSGFSQNRDLRAPSLYPVDELIENSLYVDLDRKKPQKPQGTLWVEVWVQEAVAPQHVKVFEKTHRSMFSILTHWDKQIRQELKKSFK